MKGLVLKCHDPDRKSEAVELVKAGLKYDMRSHICWHVYGLLHRADGDYVQATRAYSNALRWDSNNQQILKDMSLLQVGFKSSGVDLPSLVHSDARTPSSAHRFRRGN